MITSEEYSEARTDNNTADAVEDGFTVEYAEGNELLLDLDDEDAIARFESVRKRLANKVPLIELERWVSKSGDGIHVRLATLATESLSELERVALQACLGSDPLRECLTINDIRRGVKRPSRLFRPSATHTAKRKREQAERDACPFDRRIDADVDYPY
jgi:hypothetical protein